MAEQEGSIETALNQENGSFDTELDEFKQREFDRLLNRAGDYMHALYGRHESNSERINEVQKNMEVFFNNAGELLDADSIRLAIQSGLDAPDEETFVDKVLTAVRPVMRMQIEHPDVARRAFHERHDFQHLNEVLSYGLSEDGTVAHIHLAPAADLPNLRELVVQGLKELAKTIREHADQFEKLESVIGQSWIVAEHPRIMERLGFTIDGPVSEASAERARQHGENRPSSQASISLGKFLDLYG